MHRSARAGALSLCFVALSCTSLERHEAVRPPERLTTMTGRALAAVEAVTADARRFEPALETLTAADTGSWPEPSAEEVAALTEAPPERALGAIGRESYVMAQPSWRAKKIGYLRAGAIVKRDEKPAGNRGCAGGWYRIEPEGFVCIGKTATLDLEHPLLKATRRRPDRESALPYVYGRSRFPTPPFYTKVPTTTEQRRVEVELAKHLAGRPSRFDVVLEPIPEFLTGGAPSFTWGGTTHSPRSIYTGRAMVQSGFAFLSFFESEGRTFGLSADLDVMPVDRLNKVEPSEFHGLTLDEHVTLPVAIIRGQGAFVYRGDPTTTGLVADRPLAHREIVPIEERRVRAGGVSYLVTTDGGYLRDENLVRVDRMKNRPGWATPGRTWVDISILRQTLVAYEGEKPVYVTLVSTGADGLGDPKETHSTVRGQFLIHTKHVTATMSGDEVGDEFDLRDVPYVQYFTEGYALHAAYWHDSFGRPRSHGCINLSPMDARWLFHWTDPPVPDGWHGAMSLRQGTLVHVHP